jgi:hypothetical protein
VKNSDIYTEYKIMPTLQEHMLRVAAVAFLICDNFDETLPKDEMITACLLHDMGNIIKSVFEDFPEFVKPEGIEYWEKVKNDFIEKYGNDTHIATEMIAKEIGISKQTFSFLQSIGFSNATKNETGNSFGNKICNYSDMRVGPYGVLSMESRIEEAHKRYLGKNRSIVSNNFEQLSQSLRNIERQIFVNCKIKPEDINDETIKPIILELKNFILK